MVYVLVSIDIDFCWIDIIGVYSSKEKAEEIKFKHEYEEREKGWGQGEYWIVKRELQ